MKKERGPCCALKSSMLNTGKIFSREISSPTKKLFKYHIICTQACDSMTTELFRVEHLTVITSALYYKIIVFVSAFFVKLNWIVTEDLFSVSSLCLLKFVFF